MLNRYLTKRPRSRFYQLRVPVPENIQPLLGKKEHTKSLETEDRALAERRAVEHIARWQNEWNAARTGLLRNTTTRSVPTPFDLHGLVAKVYDESLAIAQSTRARNFDMDEAAYESRLLNQERSLVTASRELQAGKVDRWKPGAEKFLQRHEFIADQKSEWFQAFVRDFAEATISAVDVLNRRDRGELNAQPASDPVATALNIKKADESGGGTILSFDELSSQYMTQWVATKDSKKKTNTEQQKRATYALFSGFWGNLLMRNVSGPDAARFHDALKLFHPDWARSAASKDLGWPELLEKFGNHGKGLAVQTMNRHMRNLQSLWDWAKQRGHCNGTNPFIGFSRKPKLGVNVETYLPWEDDELDAIFNSPPPRKDLREVILVGMFTGMRLGEIASLTWSQIGQKDGVHFFDVIDPKTPAGVRHVPIHSNLAWLVQRAGEPCARVWPQFNEEGPSKKAGADASKLFSDYKLGLGFRSRQKTFHSFCKNVTRMMERAGVGENAWAQVIGHERGFTYGTYNPDGLMLSQKAEIIEMVSYFRLPEWMPKN